MPIDSAEKRRAAAGVPFLPLGPGVTPNASADGEWRREAGWSYPFAEVAAPVGGSLYPAGRRYLLAYLEEQEWRSLLQHARIREMRKVEGEILFDIMMERLELDFQERQNQVASYIALLSEL